MKNILFTLPNPEITSLCIGKFDGVHLAHQKLLSYLDCQGGVLVIQTNRTCLLTPSLQDLIAYPLFKVKLECIKEQDNQAFIAFLKEKFPSLRKIIVGYDFRYGKNRLYTPKDLELGFEVCVIDEVKYEGISVHKQMICEFLEQGNILKANAMLGRLYAIQGMVIGGQGRGAKECVPTLNLEIKDYILPKSGVYATYTEIEGELKESVSFLGHRLSSDGHFAIETHLLGELSSTPREARIMFLHYLRENQKFDSLSLLKMQIDQDISQAKALFLSSMS